MVINVETRRGIEDKKILHLEAAEEHIIKRIQGK